MLGGGTATTAEVAQRGYVRRLMGDGRIGPHQYRKVRRALAEIADPIGRAGGGGRTLIWRLKEATPHLAIEIIDKLPLNVSYQQGRQQ